ncbi:hypothetical protein E6L38_06965 [Bifidobacterium longum subsp. infantis]|uniref:Uncharacterized protein n=1 Tax=Bifidobacterium longum subsp. infantis TaxID=1682 RepID=A0A4S5BF38_BIFLI|nr:hypothetical protein E6L38_06965 [Bifidobacterium longum subsp. infantis]
MSVNGLHWNTVRQGQWRVCGQNYAIPPFKGSIHGGGDVPGDNTPGSSTTGQESHTRTGDPAPTIEAAYQTW